MREARTGNDQSDDKARELVHRTNWVTRRRFLPQEKVRMLTANQGTATAWLSWRLTGRDTGLPCLPLLGMPSSTGCPIHSLPFGEIEVDLLFEAPADGKSIGHVFSCGYSLGIHSLINTERQMCKCVGHFTKRGPVGQSLHFRPEGNYVHLVFERLSAMRSAGNIQGEGCAPGDSTVYYAD